MGISTSTGTLTAGQSRTFNLSPASAVTLTLSPNVRVTITESPATVTATGLGGNASRVHEPRLPGSFTYGPYPMGGSVLVEVESNSGSSVGWVRSDSIIAESADGLSSLVNAAGNSVLVTNAVASLANVVIPHAVQGWWSRPALILAGNSLYLGFATDDSAGIGVARIDTRTWELERRVIDYIDTKDDHNVPASIELSDGTILFGYTGHGLANNLMYLARTTGPDTLNIGWKTTLATTDVVSGGPSYCQFWRPEGGTYVNSVFLFYRIGTSQVGEGTWVMRRSDNNGVSWTAEVAIIATNYCNFVQDGANTGRLKFTANENAGSGTDHDTYYAFLDLNSANGDIRLPGTGVIADTGLFGGSATALPLDHSSLMKAVDIDGGDATLSMRVFDAPRLDKNASSSSSGSPTGTGVGVFMFLGMEFDTDSLKDAILYRYAYSAPSPTLFIKRAVLDPAGQGFGGTYYGGGCFHPDTPDIVYCIWKNGTTGEGGTYNMLKKTTVDGGLTWTTEVLFNNGTVSIGRPRAIKVNGVVYIEYSEFTLYNDYNDFTGSIKFCRG